MLAVVAFAAGGFALLGNDGDAAVTVAGPDGADTESQLTVPESGALAQQLADGTPVWVVRHADGSVSVVDAVSTHRPFGAGTLVGWCESSRGFVDPMYGSQYDGHGRKQAGPAPRGLDEYPVASVDGDTVTVTGTAVEQPRAADGGPEASEPAGPHCFHTDGDDDADVVEGSFRSHPVASAAPATPEDAMREPDGTLVVVDARVLVVKGQEPLVCTSEVTGPPPSCDGIPAPELFAQDETPVVMRGVFVARPDAGTLTDIAYVGERNVVEVLGVSAPTYDLTLPGAELVEDTPHTAGTTDAVLWTGGDGTYLSLAVRPGEPGTYGTPSGAGAMTKDDTFPADQGQAWLDESDDLRTATAWVVKASGDLWMLTAHWYGATVPDDPQDTVRRWALGIEHRPDASPPYVIDDSALAPAAFDAAGSPNARSRVWEYRGHEVTLLVIEGSSAAEQGNMLARGAPTVTDVPGLGEVWSVESTHGWALSRPKGAWATLAVPEA
ncbi:MAG TPA: hypothetical protein DCS55_20065, partial [Acidimicrobiaceae bacterium]|nr:hypothetical protein [Acidimicrobiaceae bacterium]